MDLKKVNKISQRYKDLVNRFVGEVQDLLPDTNSYFNIVDSIKHVILLYYHTNFESRLLNEVEVEKLLRLLSENNKSITNHDWKLIFESKVDGKDKDNFVDTVYGKEDVLMLIKIKGDIIIGGYTKTGWDEYINTLSKYNPKWSADKDAFVFYIQSPEKYEPFIAHVKKDHDSIKHAIGYYGNAYGVFGHTSNCVFYVNENLQLLEGSQIEDGYDGWTNYMKYGHGQAHLTADDSGFFNQHEYDFEVFQVES